MHKTEINSSYRETQFLRLHLLQIPIILRNYSRKLVLPQRSSLCAFSNFRFCNFSILKISNLSKLIICNINEKKHMWRRRRWWSMRRQWCLTFALNMLARQGARHRLQPKSKWSDWALFLQPSTLSSAEPSYTVEQIFFWLCHVDAEHLPDSM